MNLYSNGKLLITGEYLVLNGAEALALPLSCGQSLNYKKTTNNLIKWNSYDLKNSICLLYTSPSPRDVEESRMPSSA